MGRGERLGERALVADRDDGARPADQHPRDGHDARGVEVVGRLVEHEEVRAARGEHREGELRALAARELVGRRSTVSPVSPKAPRSLRRSTSVTSGLSSRCSRADSDASSCSCSWAK